jgi:hypothetical protein
LTSDLGTLDNPGLVYAYGQIEFDNQTNIYGSVIAANFCLPDGSNGADVSNVGGQNLVPRASRGTIHFSNKVAIRTYNWREIRR